MTVLIACDLDSTLIYSRRSADSDVPSLTCVEHRDGLPAAFMTTKAAVTLAEVAEHAYLVPVTTRTEAQLARVQLPARVEYAIAANGGRILRHGVVDASWSRDVSRRLASAAAFGAARERSQRFAASLGGRPYEVAGLFSFAVLPSPELRSDAVEAEVEWAARNGWRLSVQGRKVYWVPTGLTKSAAVVEVARRCGASPVLAAGDSLLDADLFEVADRGIRPAHGELAAAGFGAPNVTVTRGSGLLAGQEIVDWFAEQVRSAAADRLSHPAAAAPTTQD